MLVHKHPGFENDSFMFVLGKLDKLSEISLFDLDYFSVKQQMFKTKDINKMMLSDFIDRPSLHSFDEMKDASGTIYTHTCEAKNSLTYERIIEAVKNNYKVSRRCSINFADTLNDYLTNSVNTSCLNSIHYYKDNATLYFRASDVRNELLIDLHLIKEFFLDPVGEFETITVFSSTAQNVYIGSHLNNLIQ